MSCLPSGKVFHAIVYMQDTERSFFVFTAADKLDYLATKLSRHVNINPWLTLDPEAGIHTSEQHKPPETDGFVECLSPIKEA